MNPIDKNILRLALPSVVSNITVPLLGLVDLSIVGHLGSTEQIGAIAIGSTIFNMIYWVFAFLRMGTTGMTSQAHGARDAARCSDTLLRALLVALGIAAMLCLLQSPIRDMATMLMHPSEAVRPYFHTYFEICIWGAPAMLCNYALTGWFIGMQNTRIPMQVAILQNVLNIALSLLFVLHLGWGLVGIAAGTVLGLYGGTAISCLHVWMMWRKEGLGRPKWRSLLDRSELLRFVRVNIDIFLRTLCLVCVMSFFTSAGSQQNDTILSANALLMEFFMLYSFFMDGLANAAEALSGECGGARDYTLLRHTIGRLFRWAFSLGVLCTLLFIFFGIEMLQLLTNQGSVVLTAIHYLPYVWAIPLLSVLAFVWDGVFIGLCWSRQMLVSMFLASIVFFAVDLTLHPLLHNHALWLAFCCYLLTRGVVQTFIRPSY